MCVCVCVCMCVCVCVCVCDCVCVCVFNQSFLNEYFVDNVLDKQDLICLQSIKWFQVIIFFGTTLSLSRKTSSILTLSNRSVKLLTLKKALSDESKSSTFYENVFNGARRLTCQTLGLLFLFQYERVSEPCMTNAQSGYNDVFSSCFLEGSSPFSQSGLDCECYHSCVVAILREGVYWFW